MILNVSSNPPPGVLSVMMRASKPSVSAVKIASKTMSSDTGVMESEISRTSTFCGSPAHVDENIRIKLKKIIGRRYNLLCTISSPSYSLFTLCLLRNSL